MANVSFPDYLGKPLKRGYSMKPGVAYEEVLMETGLPKRRKIQDQALHTYSMTYQFDETQAKVFEYWYKNKINEGTDWFLTTKMIYNALGFHNQSCRILKGFKVKNVYQSYNASGEAKNLWEYSFSVITYGNVTDSDTNMESYL
jgi:hypothetical protein